MFKTIVLLPAIFAGASALKASTTLQFTNVAEDDLDAFSVPVKSEEDMQFRLEYTQ
jgi:hypothetical protein